MAGTKDYVFDAQALANLLVHYTGGEVPMNGEVVALLVHPQMSRKVALVIASEEWETETPLFLGYDGKRVRSWAKGDEGEPVWEQVEETPRHQG